MIRRFGDGHSYRQQRQRQRRKLCSLESLESRQLLAANLESPANIDAPSWENSFRALADAGETFGTAFDVGSLNGPQSHHGTVGGWDRRDVIQFSVADRANVEISLRNLTSDIDLYLYNARGRQLAASDHGGSRSELLQGVLNGGTYYLVIEPWAYSASAYRLTMDAMIRGPAPVPEVPPPAITPPATAPTTAPTTAPRDQPTTQPFADVPYFGGTNEWNLNSINAPEVWAQGYTGDGVTVAVIDTGVDLNHPDLLGNFWRNADEIAGNGIDDDRNGYIDDVRGWDFVQGDARPHDLNGHGTHVAGTIAAVANGVGATGVAPDAHVMPIRVLGNGGSGTTTNVAAGIRYAADNGADVINLSLGGGYSSTIWSAINYAANLGSLVVAASGNESSSRPSFPARFSAVGDNVISVGAYSSANRLATFSNDVGNSSAVQVDAPGVAAYSTYIDDRYARLSGTSMASPHVAGLAALTLSANPNLTAPQLRNLITTGADRTIGGSDSRGGINAAMTVALAAQGNTTGSVATQGTARRPSSEARFARASGLPQASTMTIVAVVDVDDQHRFEPSQRSDATTVRDTEAMELRQRAMSVDAAIIDLVSDRAEQSANADRTGSDEQAIAVDNPRLLTQLAPHWT